MTPPSRRPKSNSPRRGSYGNNISGMISIIISDIIRLFLLLSPANRREILNHLTRLTEEAEGQLPTATAQQRAIVVSQVATGGSPPPSQKSAWVSAWDRPLIRDLPYANRQRERSKKDRDLPEGRSDSRLLSAALAAVNRARKLGIPDQDVVAELVSAGEELERIRTLWIAQDVQAEAQVPSDIPMEAKASDKGEVGEAQDTNDSASTPQVRFDSSASKPFRAPNKVKAKKKSSRSYVPPEVFAAESQPHQTYVAEGTTTFVTSVLAPTTLVAGNPRGLAELPRDDLDSILGLNLASSSIPPHDLAIAFMRGEQRNFSRLREYFRYRQSDGFIVLLCVPQRWGDQSSDSDEENSPGPPSNRSGKKRKLEKGAK